MRFRGFLFALCTLLSAFSGVAAQQQQVRVGVYLMNLYDLNMDEHSFYADFYVWFKWKGKIDP
ncbi:MAG TPA: hypothetical protein PK228_02470, partial [Saprospiraceae bacterium]|nr:hypothetical protein [Saprospiraceae bacterium]